MPASIRSTTRHPSLTAFPAPATLLCLLLAGCGADGVTSVDHGLGPRLSVMIPGAGDAVMVTSSAYIPEQNRVIRDPISWQFLWAEAFRTRQPVPPAPVVDFNRDMVLLVAIGGRPNGGHSVGIDSVVVYQAGMVIEATESAPAGNCFTLSVLTSPAVAIRVPIATGEVRFRRQLRVHNC